MILRPLTRILIITLVFLSLEASAVLDLVVKEKLKVYKKKSKSSKVVTTLVRGDRVVISPLSYSGFRKVLVTYDGKRQAGYIPAKNIKISVIEDRNKIKGSPMIEEHSFGIFGSFAYTNEAEGSLELDGFPDAILGSSSGFKSFFGVTYDLPIAHLWVLHLSLANRQFFVQGNGEINIGGGTDVIEKTESAISLGAFVKTYRSRDSIFWYGAGLEVAMVNDVEVKVEGGVDLPYNGDEPTYILTNVGFGFDINISDRFYAVPEIRGGAAVNASPMILYLDAMVGVQYAY